MGLQVICLTIFMTSMDLLQGVVESAISNLRNPWKETSSTLPIVLILEGRNTDLLNLINMKYKTKDSSTCKVTEVGTDMYSIFRLTEQAL